MNRLEERLRIDEGYRKFVYKCTAGKWTIGVGRNISAGGMGLSDDEVLYLLRNDIKRVYKELEDNLPWFSELDDVRQEILINMCFNLGINRFLKFRKMLASIELEKWSLAKEHMLDSRWAEQVKGRAIRLANAMEKGAF